MAIPVLGWILYISILVVTVKIYLDLAKAFGKSTGFGVLLVLLPFIGFPILAFGPAKYVGKKFVTATPKTDQTPPAPIDTPAQ